MRCNRCKARPGTPIDVFQNDELQGSGHLCDECFDECADRADQLKLIFEGLLAAGVPRDAANAIMIRDYVGVDRPAN